MGKRSRELPGCVVALLWVLGSFVVVVTLLAIAGREVARDVSRELREPVSSGAAEPVRPRHPLAEERGWEIGLFSMVSDSEIDAVVSLIRGSGYRCDTVSSVGPTVFRPGYSVGCNRHRYVYRVEDRGGTWTVELE